MDGTGTGPMSRAILPDAEITDLTCDSRAVRPGSLFAALPGSHLDGRAFIADAIGRGARAVLAPTGTLLDPPDPAVTLLLDDNPRRRFALMAARFHGRQPATVAAVTGTNGKTSVVTFLRQIWTGLGRPAASLGTLGVVAPGWQRPGSLTTPDPAHLHATLRTLADEGVECVAMEASSHGLAQHRLDGVRVAAAGFTNISRDHLDYHGDKAAYLAAKLRLFSDVLVGDGTAVLNADSPYHAAMRDDCLRLGRRVLGYGAAGGDVRLAARAPTPAGQRLAIVVAGTRHSVEIPLVGAFQVSNALCALGLALATGAETGPAVAALANLVGAPGRMQRIGARANGALVFVDYAHTPDALANVLGALRPHCAGRLWVVFGCGGDRDRGKRPEMGRIAAGLADRVIITDDNPRGEDAAPIRRQIIAASPGAIEIGDRAEAIRAAVGGLGPGDVLVIAGKGHETGQIVGSTVLPFDDAEVARAAIAEQER